MNSVPGVVALGDRRSTCALLLRMRIVTPPWFVAPSRAVNAPYWRPAPTFVGSENNVSPGAVTVTCSVRIAVKPAADTLTVVVPPPIGSKATPPAATEVGELDCPGRTVTVRVCPAPVDVTSCATVGLVCVTVAVTAVPPILTSWNDQKELPPGSTTPILTRNAVLADNEVVVSGTDTSSIDGRYTLTVPGTALVKPGAVAVIVAVPVVTPSIPWT
jgi:hypothetical protein